MITGIVFDMDGLLFDTEELSKNGWIAAGEALGVPITREITLKLLGLNEQNGKKVLFEQVGEPFDYERARDIRAQYIDHYIEEKELPLKPGARELLQYLKENNYKTAVATSTGRERAHSYFERTGITSYFDKVICGDMIKNGKPEPDIYLAACEEIGERPENCLALEDSPQGILSASRAGMKPIMIPDLVEPGEETSRLLYRKFTSLFDVIEMLGNGNC